MYTLLIQVDAIPLSKIIQNLGFRYTRYINQQRKTVGHLFQGRYKAILVDADRYLLALTRYIHLNPVRAGLCNTADDDEWSSHHAYLAHLRHRNFQFSYSATDSIRWGLGVGTTFACLLKKKVVKYHIDLYNYF